MEKTQERTLARYVSRYFILTLFSAICLAGVARGETIFTWTDCLRETEKNNPELVSAREEVNRQRASKSAALSGFFPKISAAANFSRSKGGGGGSSGSSQDAYSYGLSATQILFEGLKTVNEVNAAREMVNAAEYEYRFVVSNAGFALRNAFVELMMRQRLIGVLEEIIKVRKDNMGLVSLKYGSGLEHKGALLTAEANVAEAEFELAQAKRALVLAQRKLSKEMGSRELLSIVADGRMAVSDEEKIKPDLLVLAAVHPRYLRYESGTKAAGFNVKSAYADFYPVISVSGGAGMADDRFAPRDDYWKVGLGVSLPIFEGGLRTARARQAEAAYNKTYADTESFGDGIVVNLERSWAYLRDAAERVDVQEKSLIAAEERRRIAEAQYSSGFISFDNWIIIENDFVRAKKTHLQVLADALFAEAEWFYAKGEILEYE